MYKRQVEAGCLNCCNRGVAVLAFSGDGEVKSETWYTHVSADQAEDLLEAHVGNNEPYRPALDTF